MNHRAMQDQWQGYYDGELPAPARRVVERHLEICADCREAYTRWKCVARAVFPKAETAAPSAAFTEKLMDRIWQADLPSAPPQRWRGFGWLVPVAGFAAAALLLAVVPEEPPLSAGGFWTEAAGSSMLSGAAPDRNETLEILLGAAS